jgi:hypothetical protein
VASTGGRWLAAVATGEEVCGGHKCCWIASQRAAPTEGYEPAYDHVLVNCELFCYQLKTELVVKLFVLHLLCYVVSICYEFDAKIQLKCCLSFVQIM